MKTISTNVKSKSLLPKCWIYQNQNYQLNGINRPALPYVSSEYEALLKKFNIPYRFIDNGKLIEYWNPSCYEEESITLPVYAKVLNQYQYLGKNHTGLIPTIQTIEEALKTSKKINREIYNYNDILSDVDTYQNLKLILNGEICKVSTDITIPGGGHVDIEMNNDHFRVYGYKLFSIIFDLNKISPDSCLTVYVPHDIMGAVIGKGGSNVKYWTTHLNVIRIKVVSYD